MSTVQEQFDAAWKGMSKLKSKPTNEETLEIYGYGKVGKAEDDIKTAKAPGIFDPAGKHKRESWQKVVNAGYSKEEAQKKYIEKYNELVKKYGTN